MFSFIILTIDLRQLLIYDMSQSTWNLPLSQTTNIIQRDFTCITYQLPMNLACDFCKKELDPLSFTRHRKKTKTDRQLSRNHKCRKPWDIQFATTTKNTMQHNKIRTFLNFESDSTIEYVSVYNKDYKSYP